MSTPIGRPATRGLLGNVGWLAGAQATAALLSLAKFGVATRLLDKESLGLYSLLLVYALVGNRVGGLGLSASLLHFRNLTTRQLNALLYTNLAVAAVVAAGSLLSITFLEDRGLFAAAAALALSIVFRVPGTHYETLRTNDHAHRFNAIAQASTSLLAEVAAIALLYTGFGLFGLAAGQALSTLLYSGVQAVAGHRRYQAGAWTAGPLVEVAPMLRFGGWQLADGMIGLVASRLDRLIVSVAFGLSALGAYELAVQLTAKPTALASGVIYRIFGPLYAERGADLTAINRLYVRKLRILVVGYGTIYGWLAWQARPVVELLFGPGWDLTATTVVALSGFAFAKALVNPIGSYLIAIGHPEELPVFNLWTSLTYACLLGLGWVLGDYGLAIWIYGIGGATIVVWLDRRVRLRRTGMRSGPIHAMTLRTVLIVSVAVLSGAALTWLLAPASEWWRFVVGSAGYALIAGLGGMWALGGLQETFSDREAART